mmetsp:Transcript_33027/g.60885  ORF Transcript_33027/g.60885 Transcript_33027/m.60885 type:complete len:150 (+) Transcript_33027:97-546(+)
MANPQCMVAGRRAFRTRLSIPYPSRQHHLLPITPPDMMAGFYRRRSRGKPSSTAVYPSFIRHRRRGAAADQMAPPLNIQDVYFLVQIDEDIIPHSFVIGAIRLERGRRKILTRGAVCLRKRHMHVVAMEDVRDGARGGCGELWKSGGES